MDYNSKYNKTVKIFYSWQSSINEKLNRYFLRDIIKKSKIILEGKHNELEIIIEQATRDVTGSVDIAQSIFDKIELSDIFIADVSEIISNEKNHSSNPNVLIELGFAASKLGWDRIIMIFNKSFGTVENLPFDINHRLIFQYQFHFYSKSEEKKIKDYVSPILVNILASMIVKINNIEDSPINKIFTYIHNRIANSMQEMKFIIDAIYRTNDEEWDFEKIELEKFDKFCENISPNSRPTGFEYYENWYILLRKTFKSIDLRVFEILLFKDDLSEIIVSILIQIQNHINQYKSLGFMDGFPLNGTMNVITPTIKDVYITVFALKEEFYKESEKYFDTSANHFHLPLKYSKQLFFTK